MRILRDPALAGPCVLILGMFDGVHRGHQALLMRGAELAEAHELPLVVCTFEPHPLEVLMPDRAPKRLTTPAERAGLMASFGVDDLCVHTFTHELASRTPEAFARMLTEIYQPRYVVCGFNFTFGREGRGNGSLLCAYGAAHGFETCVIPAVEVDGETVSSTRARKALEGGDIRALSRMLGHAWTLTGPAEDAGNIAGAVRVDGPAVKALPACGVYACYLSLRDGESFRAMVQVSRTTEEDSPKAVTALLLDERVKLAGETVRLTFMECLRPAKRFDSPEAYTAQLQQDAETAKAFFARIE